MNIVLLSGGSGKRLWPLSNDTMSKQFLSLLPTEDGKTESMVQRVYRQIKAADPEANIVVSTNQAQKGSLVRQLGQGVDIVVEPERRNTFPAVLLASAYMHYEKGLGEDDVVIVLPIDVFANESYFTNLFNMEKELKSGHYNLMLMGAKPTYPSEKYGYIVPCEYRQGEAMAVKEFKEKPEISVARQLLKAGALWNCGIFGFKMSYIMEILGENLKVDSFAQLLESYEKLAKDSFDYQVVEKEKQIGCIEYVGKWKDLGTWNTLTEEMERESVGTDIYISDSCRNTHVLNMLDTPIIAMGLNNVVVVASHDGILVSDKMESSYLKPYADKIT
ncbi:MAG: sugar phosphate nucleotidyltransferase, partial [Oscillospiraceae bacterium]